MSRRLTDSQAFLTGGLLAASSFVFVAESMWWLLFVVSIGSSLVAYHWGLRRHRPPGMAAWRLVELAFPLTLASRVLAHRDGPEGALLALQLAGYACAVAGVVLILRARGSRHDREGLVDASILATGCAMVLLQLLLVPGAPMAGRADLVIYVLLDSALFGLIARLAFTASLRTPALLLMCAGLGVNLAGDVLFLADVPYFRYIDVIAVVTLFVFMAAAALHPSIVRVAAPAADLGEQLQPLRLIVLGASLVTCNIVVGSYTLRSEGWGHITSAVGPTVLAILVVLRLAWALRDHESVRADLADRAHRDALTGLANRARITVAIDEALERAAGRPERVGVLFCDLDRFKYINDALGHSAGDAVLCAVAGRIASAVRGSDTVGRLGGDEFVICIDRVNSLDGLRAIAQGLVEAISGPIVVDGHELEVSPSVGVAIGSPGVTSEELLRDADTAMYEAKGAGGGRTKAAYRGQGRHTRGMLERDLRRALADSELLLHYQPVIDLASNRTVAAEALVRWNHPERGLLSPAAFVPFAERSPLVDAFGEYVLRAALTQVAHSGPGVDEVWVNVSPRQLRPELPDMVRSLLADAGAPARRLCLELTETTNLDESPEIVDTLQRLRDLGVRLALDDFGAGHSSLTNLRWVPADRIKLDRSFTADLDKRNAAISIVGHMIALAHECGLRVVAEGVEEPGQLATLRRLGCDAAQGYLLGRPSPRWPAAAGLTSEPVDALSA
jgi:diguanylate cyclase (GGDEF)-like protein